MTETTIHEASDVAAALDAARANVEVIPHEAAPSVLVIAQRDDVSVNIVDLEEFLDRPTRRKGTLRALTAAGFVRAVQRLEGEPSVVYADIDATRLVAVLNDDDGATPGWRDLRVTYEPEQTPEWKHWIAGQGLGDQGAFAATLEGGETEIRDPSATSMLDLAQTFHASTSAKFKQAGRMRDGRVQLAYEEEIEATAGEGLVAIPEKFTIEVRPFYGAEPRTIECKLRYRLDRGELRIGYTIHRPEEILRDAFIADVVEGTVALAGLTTLDARPAEVR